MNAAGMRPPISIGLSARRRSSRRMARSVIAASSSSPVPLIVSGATPRPNCGARAVTAHRCVSGHQQARPTSHASGRSPRTSRAARSSFAGSVMTVMAEQGTARRGPVRCPKAAIVRPRYCTICTSELGPLIDAAGSRDPRGRRLAARIRSPRATVWHNPSAVVMMHASGEGAGATGGFLRHGVTSSGRPTRAKCQWRDRPRP